MAITAVNLGTNSQIGIGASGQGVDGTFDTIGGLTNKSISISHDAVDTTNDDDSGFTSAEYGNTTVTLSLEGRYDDDDAGQAALRTAAADLDGSSKVKKAFEIRPIVATGEDAWAFDGIITSFEITMNNNEPVDFSCEIQSTGSVEYDTQDA